jgi:hypothetical protein
MGASLANNALAFENLGKDCKAYAKSVFAVAEARDNLDEPSMEQLKKLHPIIKELEDTKSRAWLYLSLINLRIINKNAAPKALMKDSYENCINGGGFCLMYGKGCPND